MNVARPTKMKTVMRVLRDWPMCLDAEGAVDYTGLSVSEIARASKDGRLTFKPLGSHGRKVVRISELDSLLSQLFADQNGSPLEDMDFGND